MLSCLSQWLSCFLHPSEDCLKHVYLLNLEAAYDRIQLNDGSCLLQATVAYYLMSDNRRRMPSSAYLRSAFTEAHHQPQGYPSGGVLAMNATYLQLQICTMIVPSGRMKLCAWGNETIEDTLGYCVGPVGALSMIVYLS